MGNMSSKNTIIETTGGAAHVYGLARNMEKVVAAGSPSGEFYGFLVATAATADDTAINMKAGAVITGITKEAFAVGQVYPIHGEAASTVVGTGGVFYFFLADA